MPQQAQEHTSDLTIAANQRGTQSVESVVSRGLVGLTGEVRSWRVTRLAGCGAVSLDTPWPHWLSRPVFPPGDDKGPGVAA